MSTQTPNLALLDRDLDDIEDIAGFETPINGVYTLKFSTNFKTVNGKPAVVADFEVISCEEQQDPDAAPTRPGTKFGVLFMIENEIALSRLKDLLKQPSDHFGVRNLGKLVEETCKDLICVAKVKRRKNKDDEDKPYAEVSNLVVA